MLAMAAPIIVWSAILKIIIASLVGGAGVAIVFGFVVLGVERGTSPNAGGTVKAVNFTMAALASAFCVFAVVVGIYAIVKK